MIRSFMTALTALTLAACAGSGKPRLATQSEPEVQPVETAVPACGPQEAAFDCDRHAILAMQGEFQVSFRFEETAVLAPGYQRKPEHRSGGYETVVLVQDTGRRIDLQHLLVVGDGHVVKHWRQSWVYEADSIWRFQGDQTFRREARSAEAVPGTWTQYVYEVSDAPRYAGSGRWNHRYGVSTWTSDRTWRPLPRREYTKRSDYQLLIAENRHTITPQGWTHEQDNTKVRRGAGGKDAVLVREFGFNDYRRIRGHDFRPAYRYWEQTAPFWAQVRQRWEVLLADPAGLRLAYPVDDEKFIGSMFEAAENYAESPDDEVAQTTLDSLFARAVDTVPSASERTASKWARVSVGAVFAGSAPPLEGMDDGIMPRPRPLCTVVRERLRVDL